MDNEQKNDLRVLGGTSANLYHNPSDTFIHCKKYPEGFSFERLY